MVNRVKIVTIDHKKYLIVDHGGYEPKIFVAPNRLATLCCNYLHRSRLKAVAKICRAQCERCHFMRQAYADIRVAHAKVYKICFTRDIKKVTADFDADLSKLKKHKKKLHLIGNLISVLKGLFYSSFIGGLVMAFLSIFALSARDFILLQMRHLGNYTLDLPVTIYNYRRVTSTDRVDYVTDETMSFSQHPIGFNRVLNETSAVVNATFDFTIALYVIFGFIAITMLITAVVTGLFGVQNIINKKIANIPELEPEIHEYFSRLYASAIIKCGGVKYFAYDSV